jgi:multidrug resistance efflux pump
MAIIINWSKINWNYNTKMDQTPSKSPIELRSPEFHKMIDKPPSLLLRSGSLILSGMIMLLILISFLLKYPNMIDADVLITTQNPPVWLTARTSGPIQHLYGKPDMPVQKGQLLAVIQNTACLPDIQQLEQWLKDSTLYNMHFLLQQPLLLKNDLKLGELQTTWSQVVRCFEDYYLTSLNREIKIRDAGFRLKKQTMETQLHSLHHKEQAQLRINNLLKACFERDKSLYDKGLISKEQYQESEQNMLNGLQLLEDIRLSACTLEAEKQDINQTLENDHITHIQLLTKYSQAYQAALKELAVTLEKWKQTYCLYSPIQGILIVADNQHALKQVQTGQKLFAVIPEKTGPTLLYLRYDNRGNGIVQPGQTALIHWKAIPIWNMGKLKQPFIIRPV